jgi:hypothetical protein
MLPKEEGKVQTWAHLKCSKGNQTLQVVVVLALCAGTAGGGGGRFGGFGEAFGNALGSALGKANLGNTIGNTLGGTIGSTLVNVSSASENEVPSTSNPRERYYHRQMAIHTSKYKHFV